MSETVPVGGGVELPALLWAVPASDPPPPQAARLNNSAQVTARAMALECMTRSLRLIDSCCRLASQSAPGPDSVDAPQMISYEITVRFPGAHAPVAMRRRSHQRGEDYPHDGSTDFR